MTSRDLVRVAMEKERPERTPVMCQLALGHYFLNVDGDAADIWHDTDAFAAALVELQRRYRFDGILVNLPGRDPEWRRHVASRDVLSDGRTRLRWRNGWQTVVPPDDNPRVLREDGEPFRVPLDDVDPERLFYVEPHDPAGVTYPTSLGFGRGAAPVGGEAFFPDWQCDTVRRVRELTGGAVSVHAEVFSPFSQFMELVGYSEALMSLRLDPGKVGAVLSRLAEGAACLGALYAREGCDAVLVSSAFVGAGFIGREDYRAFELPYLGRIVEGVREARSDVPVYVHTCGAIGDRLDLMEASRVDGIDTLDPPPLGTVDLESARRALGTRVFIKGNIDPVNTVLRGTPEDVRRAARERLDIVGADGAYILSTACSVPPRAPPENVLALAETVADG
ncbi:MAG: uroporphyrinogen decarboxylase family protein [Gemmatimonadota bacterium]|jgi:hypothetical protein